MDAYIADLTSIVAILIGGALLMVPVLGLTLRFTVPPIMESVARLRWASGDADRDGERRARNGASRTARETV